MLYSAQLHWLIVDYLSLLLLSPLLIDCHSHSINSMPSDFSSVILVLHPASPCCPDAVLTYIQPIHLLSLLPLLTRPADISIRER